MWVVIAVVVVFAVIWIDTWLEHRIDKKTRDYYGWDKDRKD